VRWGDGASEGVGKEGGSVLEFTGFRIVAKVMLLERAAEVWERQAMRDKKKIRKRAGGEGGGGKVCDGTGIGEEALEDCRKRALE